MCKSMGDNFNLYSSKLYENSLDTLNEGKSQT